MTNPPGTIWPSDRQRLLLTAALADPPSAVAAWQEVRPQASIDEDELGAFQLLPLIYRNLRLAGHDDADLQRLKGIYRRAWARNNLFAERMKSITNTLDQNGIRAEFVEGVTIASRFYGELGLRPTSAISSPDRSGRQLEGARHPGTCGLDREPRTCEWQRVRELRVRQ